MTDFLLEGDALERLQREVRLFGSQKELAGKAGIPATTLSQIVSKGGDVSISRLGKIAAALGRPLDYFWSGEVAHQDLGLMPVREVDLAYGMGGTFIDDLEVSAAIQHLPAAWIRQFTRAPAEHLFLCKGIGDSMMPTLLDSDLLLVDQSQDTLKQSDRIWVLTVGDVGMVKRVRVMADGNLAILSDNASVPEMIAVDGEARLVGRVVAVIRKL